MLKTDALCHMGQPAPIYGVRGNILRFEILVRHDGLHKTRTIKALDEGTLTIHARSQLAQWAEQWGIQQAKQRRANERDRRVQEVTQTREAKKAHIDAQRQLADTMTTDAQGELNVLRGVLAAALDREAPLSWGAIQPQRTFEVPRPRKQSAPPRPLITAPPPEASPSPIRERPRDEAFAPKLGLLDKFLKARRLAKEADARTRCAGAIARWEADRDAAHAEDQARLVGWRHACQEAERRADEAERAYADRLKALDQLHQAELALWQDEKRSFEAAVASDSEALAELQRRCEAKEADAVAEFSEMILAASEYPDACPREFDTDFDSETGLLILDYKLPAPEALPRLAEVKYVASTDSFTEKELSDAKVGDLYDDLLYQIALRTIHELVNADVAGVLQSIVFNGHVSALDKGTGKEVAACILSLHAPRDKFLALALDKVDPKTCFRQLKGVGSSKLHGIAAVAPIMTINREDSRFVPSHGVTAQLDQGDNLASMEWEEFEHLIREIFSREFSAGGGEVHVTQASRDGGVDAIAFDPDPIRGGKIVIQAKRYTNVVGVSAVRDLYGTVMNEGATKGILVTTANYGPDSYEFAKGKPLTLLNGANLLHLLSKHGVKARIDVNEARKAAGLTPHRQSFAS